MESGKAVESGVSTSRGALCLLATLRQVTVTLDSFCRSSGHIAFGTESTAGSRLLCSESRKQALPGHCCAGLWQATEGNPSLAAHQLWETQSTWVLLGPTFLETSAYLSPACRCL